MGLLLSGGKMITKEVLYVAGDRDGGHYHVTADEKGIVRVYRWEGDTSWTNAGELLFVYDTENVGMIEDHMLRDYEIPAYLVLCSFLRDHIDRYMSPFSEFVCDRSAK